jgi:uncharacterized LabA/DUF88 family protein
VLYFSAFAKWKPNSYQRHRKYVRALRATGVTPIMAEFRERLRECKKCGAKWSHHEEKQTDVAIGARLYAEAARDNYDRALVVSADSDLVPAILLVREDFPMKSIGIVAPTGRHYVHDLMNAAGDRMNREGQRKRVREIRRSHLEDSLLPREVLNHEGDSVAIRPARYDPPA